MRLKKLLNTPTRFALTIAAAACLVAAPASAQKPEARVVELYENCKLTDTNLVLGEGVLSPGEVAEVKARVAAVTEDPTGAVPRIVQVLRNYGIEDVEIARQGFEGCEPETSGKYVEAVGTYCGADLRSAEVFVDRESFMGVTDPDISFEEFLRRANQRLRTRGIPDRPIVSIENAPDCTPAEQTETGGESAQN